MKNVQTNKLTNKQIGNCEMGKWANRQMGNWANVQMVSCASEHVNKQY